MIIHHIFQMNFAVLTDMRYSTGHSLKVKAGQKRNFMKKHQFVSTSWSQWILHLIWVHLSRSFDVFHYRTQFESPGKAEQRLYENLGIKSSRQPAGHN
jgi:hypothetical protein